MDEARRIRILGPQPAADQSLVDQGLVVVVGRWSGALAGALRAATRDTIDDWAVGLGVGTSTAGDWEERPDIVPQPVNQQALDTVLRRADEETKRRFVTLTDGDSLVWASDLAGLAPNGAPTNRRDAAKAVAAAGVTAAFAPLDVVERLAAQDGHPVDAGLVAAHEKFAGALAELHITKRPDQLASSVAQQADELLRLLDSPMTQADRRRLEAVTVSSCAHAGWLAFRMGDRRSACGCFALARSVADHSGDDVLRAQALGVGAILLSPMPGGGRGGDPKRFASTLSQAVDCARGADPDTRASLHGFWATALAGTGSEHGFRHAAGVVERLADQVGDAHRNGWLAGHFARGRDGQARDGQLGVGLLLLRRPEPAVEAFTRALAGPRQGSHRVALLVDMAAAQVLLGEPEAACAGLREALDLAERVGHGMGVQRALGVRAGFPPQWAGLACVRDLDARLRLVA